MDEVTRTAEGLRFGCPACGSGLQYDIASARMKCGSCGQSYDLSEIEDPSVNASDGKMDAAEYRCPQCGAAVHTTQTSAASFCSYCGADVILTQRYTRVNRPKAIVPFRVTREQCEEIYRKRVAQAKYAPADFSAQPTIDHFRPVYVPFWRYRGDADVQGAVGSAVHHHHDSRYDYSDEYSFTLSGGVHMTDVVYDAALSFEDETALKLRFSAKRAQPFHAACLCGFYAETPDTPSMLFGDGMRELAGKKWQETFRKQISGYDGAKARFPEDQLEVSADLMLMPVWLLAHRSGDRVVYTAINGDSGEIVCDTPVSNSRFARLALTLSCIAAAVLLALQFVLVLRPRLLAALCGVIAACAQWIIGRLSRDMRIRSQRQNDLSWMRAHPDQEKQKVKKITGGMQWYIPALIICLPVLAGTVFAAVDAYNANSFWASMLSDHAWLPVVLQLCAIAVFLAGFSQRQDTLDDILFYVRLAAMLAALGVIVAVAADLPLYLCCIGLMMLTAISLARLNRAHNVFVSRPVPFFGKEGEEA